MNLMAHAQWKLLIWLFWSGVLICGIPATSLAGYSQVEPLWFSLSPADGVKPEAGNGGKTRPGRGHSAGRFESEHRPLAMRKYYLNQPNSEVQGVVLHPDQTISKLAFDFEGAPSAFVELAMSDGPHHGANNFYAFDQEVVGETLNVRNAKWVTIQHSCRWGHGLKFTKERQKSQSLETVPLEIIVDDLWDTNFHSTVMSGDEIHLKVLCFGQPAIQARVTITSEKGWKKTIMTDNKGEASFQLLRDYYPNGWAKFHRTEKGQLKFKADFKNNESGEFKGQKYTSTHYSATFIWRYYPARREYTSLVVGLLIAVLGAGLTGTGFFLYRRKRWTGMKRLVWDA